MNDHNKKKLCINKLIISGITSDEQKHGVEPELHFYAFQYNVHNSKESRP